VKKEGKKGRVVHAGIRKGSKKHPLIKEVRKSKGRQAARPLGGLMAKNIYFKKNRESLKEGCRNSDRKVSEAAESLRKRGYSGAMRRDMRMIRDYRIGLKGTCFSNNCARSKEKIRVNGP